MTLGVSSGVNTDEGYGLSDDDEGQVLVEEEGDVGEDLAEAKVARAAELRTEALAAFKEYRNYNRIDLCAKGEIPERVTHNDTKLNNVMIDDATETGICVVDLDTVMPGLALYDFGDMVRTATSPALEDEPDVSKVRMQMPMFEALVNGYLTSARSFLNEAEIAHLAFSGKLITLEIGIRFLTDYLEGDVYFKLKHPTHNLDRLRTQLALVKSIEDQEEAMNDFVRKASK
jgi:aminoglycoside phosphotransferase (APT) family kinase protein